MAQKVADPYRWLENYLDPEVQEWVDQQNKHTQSFWQRIFTGCSCEDFPTLNRFVELSEIWDTCKS